MTYSETLVHVARLAYNEGLVTENDLARLIQPKSSNKNYRTYQRVKNVLVGTCKNSTGARK